MQLVRKRCILAIRTESGLKSSGTAGDAKTYTSLARTVDAAHSNCLRPDASTQLLPTDWALNHLAVRKGPLMYRVKKVLSQSNCFHSVNDAKESRAAG